MKQIIKILIYILIILNIINISNSQTRCNPNLDATYKDLECLRISDATKWNPTKIDWSNPAVFENPSVYNRKDIYSNPKVYNNPAFYKKLPDYAYKLLNYKLVQYDKINHDKIDGAKYLASLGCRGCEFEKEGWDCSKGGNKCVSVNILPSGTLQYSKDGIRHKNGDYISVSNYANIIVVATDQVIIMKAHRNARLKIPQTDSFTLIANYNRINYEGKDVLISSGLVFKNGVMFVSKEYDTVYFGVMISTEVDKVRLFFDGKEHNECQCSYVSLDTGRKIIISNVKEGTPQPKEFSILRLMFGAVNQFIKIQGPLEIRQNFGTIIFQNRENQNLIPEIKMSFNPELKYQRPNSIKNGNAEVQVFDRNSITGVIVHDSQLPKEFKSNPLVLIIEDKNGQSLLGSKQQPKKIIFGENNEMSTLDYKTISTLEPIRLYFRASNDVKAALEKAKEAHRRASALQEEARRKWGLTGVTFFPYLDDHREAPILRGLSTNCGRLNLPLDFCTAVAFNEGLHLWMDSIFYIDPKAEVSGFFALGLDTFGSEVETLKRGGYLRKDFSEFKVSEAENEQRQKVKTATFKNIDVALEAFAARLKWTRDNVLKDAASRGYKLNQDQLDYWTYIYWNCGHGCGTQRLRREGPQIPSGLGSGSLDPVPHAKNVMATRDLVRKSGIFDRTLPVQTASK
ncbi:hypothetical protein HYX02_02555 [Candidatus Woesearchaeota archaeon]|nr:hypothetical protein [Candidatus Woesearchaeota archaeon]